MPRPLNVILDLTSRCNLKCVMCYFAATDRLAFPPFDRQLSDDGNMPVEVFERIAADLFPKAWRVALACAAEPMIHPRFREIVEIAGRYGVPDLWFPTNLLALTEPTAQALVKNGVGTVAASIDGVTKETYEKIRVPAKFERLLACLDTLARVRREAAVEDAAPADHLHVDEVQPPGARPAARVRRRPWRLRRSTCGTSRRPRAWTSPRSCSRARTRTQLNAELGGRRPRRRAARAQAVLLSGVRASRQYGPRPARARPPPALAVEGRDGPAASTCATAGTRASSDAPIPTATTSSDPTAPSLRASTGTRTRSASIRPMVSIASPPAHR